MNKKLTDSQQNNTTEKSDKGDEDMAVLAKPMEFMPVIREDKFDEFMKESEKTIMTKEELNELHKLMKNVIHKSKKGFGK